MRNIIFAAATLLLATTSAALAQQGGTFTPDTTTSQGTNSGGPVGSQAVPRPTQAVTNDVAKRGRDCETMNGTATAQRPATAGANDPQPQAKCSDVGNRQP